MCLGLKQKIVHKMDEDHFGPKRQSSNHDGFATFLVLLLKGIILSGTECKEFSEAGS